MDFPVLPELTEDELREALSDENLDALGPLWSPREIVFAARCGKLRPPDYDSLPFSDKDCENTARISTWAATPEGKSKCRMYTAIRDLREKRAA